MRGLPLKNILLAIVVVCMAGCSSPVANLDSRGRAIVCFGDSLTSGYGAGEGEDYPSVLRSKVTLPVVSAGVPGDTTRDALARLETDVLEKDPRIVIITLGGNDFLKHVPKAETLANMEAIIDRLTARGAMVVWAVVKTGLLGDAYQKDFAQLARRKRIMLIPDVLHGIMFDPRYKSDQIHPNAEGYRLMAERIYRHIRGLIT